MTAARWCPTGTGLAPQRPGRLRRPRRGGRGSRGRVLGARAHGGRAGGRLRAAGRTEQVTSRIFRAASRQRHPAPGGGPRNRRGHGDGHSAEGEHTASPLRRRVSVPARPGPAALSARPAPSVRPGGLWALRRPKGRLPEEEVLASRGEDAREAPAFPAPGSASPKGFTRRLLRSYAHPPPRSVSGF